MSKRTVAIIVLSAILLLSLGAIYYQTRVSSLMAQHYAQQRRLDSLQIVVNEAAIQVLTQRTAELQRAYLEQKNRNFALKVNTTNTKGKTDKELADILRQKLNIPMGGN